MEYRIVQDDDALYGDIGNDILIGGTGSDGLYGGSGDDILVYDAADYRMAGDSVVPIDSEGYDILKVLDSSVVLNVVGHIHSIEEINLDSAFTNTLTLDAQAVINMSTTDSIKVTGDASDSLHLSGGWTQGADRAGFTTYTSTIG